MTAAAKPKLEPLKRDLSSEIKAQAIKYSAAVDAERSGGTPRGDYVVWDAKLSGFGIRLRASGARSYIAETTGTVGGRQKTRRFTLGKPGATPLKDARDEAIRLMQALKKGVDEVEERAKRDAAAEAARAAAKRETSKAVLAATTWRQAVEFYEGLRTLAETTKGTLKRNVLRFGEAGKWLDSPMLETTTSDVLKIHRNAEALVLREKNAGDRTTGETADKLVRQLSTLWRHWVNTHKRDLDVAGIVVPENPTGAVMSDHMVQRVSENEQRVLTDAELRKVWPALSKFDPHAYAPLYFKVLLATALRADTTLDLRWSWWDRKAGVLNIPATARGHKGRRKKLNPNNKAYLCIPVIPALRAVLVELEAARDYRLEHRLINADDADFVFPSGHQATGGGRRSKGGGMTNYDYLCQQVWKAAGIERFGAHAVKRTIGRVMQELGIHEFEQALVLHHAVSRQFATTAGYSQREKRYADVLAQISAEIARRLKRNNPQRT